MLSEELASGIEKEAAPPDPKASYSQVCDYLLGDFTESSSGFRFVADAHIKNAGNVGIEVDVTASWDQIGGAPFKATKTVRIPYGGKKKVSFTRVATQDQIDRHQSTNAHCRVKARIVETFGETQSD